MHRRYGKIGQSVGRSVVGACELGGWQVPAPFTVHHAACPSVHGNMQPTERGGRLRKPGSLIGTPRRTAFKEARKSHRLAHEVVYRASQTNNKSADDREVDDRQTRHTTQHRRAASREGQIPVTHVCRGRNRRPGVTIVWEAGGRGGSQNDSL